MDGRAFDDLSRAVAGGVSRRGLFGLLGLGAAGGTGLGRARGARAAGACTLQLVAAVSTGPERGTRVEGELTFTVTDDGAIDDGLLVTPAGDELEVVGQATGRELRLQVDLGDGTRLALTGAGQRDVLLCRGRFAGTVAGPGPGDIGSWLAGKGSAGGGNSGRADSGTSSGGNGSGGSTGSGSGGNGGGTGNGGGNGDNNGNGNGNGGSGCPQGQTVCSGACVDLLTNNDNCGACGLFCASGTVCQNATCVDAGCGNDPVSGNPLTICNGICVDPLKDDANCGQCGNACGNGHFCVEGKCECFITSGGGRATDCGGFCADLLTDVQNCGACGAACQGFNRRCVNGQCACLEGACLNPAMTPCPTPGGDPCVAPCVDLMSDPMNCGACGNICFSGRCENGFCADLEFPNL